MTRAQCAENAIILYAAGTAERRERLRALASGLAREADWARLAATLRHRRLLSTLGPRLVAIVPASAAQTFSMTVAETVAATRRHTELLDLVRGRVTGMLHAARVSCAALKGSEFGARIYRDGCRAASDIDLLVSAHDLERAGACVRELGYRFAPERLDREGLPALHLALVHETLPPIELHWRVHWYDRRFAGERLLPVADESRQWRAAPADELAALLLFYARDGFADLRLASDVAAWWDTYGSLLGGGELSRVAASYPELDRVLTAAASAAERVVGLPASKLTGGGLRLGVRERLSVRLANPNPASSAAQLHADIAVVDALLSPRGGHVAFLRRQVLVPRAVLAARAGARQRPMTPAGHAFRVLVRYAFSVLRLLRRPELLPSPPPGVLRLGRSA